MSRFDRHERGDRIKWIIIFTVVAALIVGFFAIVTKGFKQNDPKKWFGNECITVSAESGSVSSVPTVTFDVETKMFCFALNGSSGSPFCVAAYRNGKYLNDQYNKRYGFLEKTVWICNEFSSWSEYESGENGTKTKYEYEGDIHDCYDSQGCFLMFFNGNEDKDFNLRKNRSFGIDKESSLEYNKSHRYEVPETFYKKRS